MPRVRKGAARTKKHKRVLKAAKGMYGANSRRYRTAKQQIFRAGPGGFFANGHVIRHDVFARSERIGRVAVHARSGGRPQQAARRAGFTFESLVVAPAVPKVNGG